MVRRIEKIVLSAMILLAAAGIAAEPPPGPASPKPATETSPSPAARDGSGAVRLDEVRITGTPEYPGVLFFLPRPRFHLLQLRAGKDGKESIPGENRGTGSPAR